MKWIAQAKAEAEKKGEKFTKKDEAVIQVQKQKLLQNLQKTLLRSRV